MNISSEEIHSNHIQLYPEDILYRICTQTNCNTIFNNQRPPKPILFNCRMCLFYTFQNNAIKCFVDTIKHINKTLRNVDHEYKLARN